MEILEAHWSANFHPMIILKTIDGLCGEQSPGEKDVREKECIQFTPMLKLFYPGLTKSFLPKDTPWLSKHFYDVRDYVTLLYQLFELLSISSYIKHGGWHIT